MKSARMITAAVVMILLSTSAAAPAGGRMGVSRGHDLDDLWARAQTSFDLKAHDSVLLLESRHETVREDGGRKTVIHRVVWIGTSPGLHDHADLRIPWNTMNSTFKVLILRTWRDGRWWPDESTVSATAVVETLPYAVASADDYTTMRETMLLHDGIELPCILETAYEIEEDPGAPGYDGLFVMQQPDPAVLVELKVTVPEGPYFSITGGNGAPVPETANAAGSDEHVITMENLERLGSPRTADPSAYAPYITWSTWSGWEAIKDAVLGTFEEAAVAGPEIAALVSERLEGETGRLARAEKAAGLVDEYARYVRYDSRFWRFRPRPASRTWETAYGHALDRAVLAAAIFRQAGLEAEPLFVTPAPGTMDLAFPGLSRFGEMLLCVHSGDFRAVYDPAEGTLSAGPRSLYGHSAWKPATDDAPWSYPPPDELLSSYEVTLNIEPGDDGAWKGTGYLLADGIFCPYAEMTGLGGEMKETLEGIAASVLGGADVTLFNPEVFEKTRVTARFEFTMPRGDPDRYGRRAVTTGSPRGGIGSVLPGDVKLYHESRTSPVTLPAVMSQKVTVRIKTGGDEVIFLPEKRSLGNEAGSFSVSAESGNGWIKIERTLSLEGGVIRPGAWPQLRALLLEEQDLSGRKILLR